MVVTFAGAFLASCGPCASLTPLLVGGSDRSRAGAAADRRPPDPTMVRQNVASVCDMKRTLAIAY